MPYSLWSSTNIYIYSTQILIGKFEKYISSMRLSKWCMFSTLETDYRNEIISKLKEFCWLIIFLLLEIKYMA